MIKFPNIRRKAFVILSALALAMPASPITAHAKGSAAGYAIEFVDSNFDGTNTTFTWRLTGPEGGDPASHVVIETCFGANTVDENGTAGDPVPHGKDGSTGMTGWKWEGSPAIGETFTLSFAGDVPEKADAADWLVKKQDVVTGTATGPDCDPPPETGSITIVKDAVPDDAQDFSFTGDLGSFSLDDDDDGTLPNSETFTELDAGTYEVTEEATAGWTLTDISCDDESTGDTGTRTATIVLAEGEDVTCTFTNTQDEAEPETGSITIVKDAVPDHAQDFSFTGDLGSFSLDDDDDGTLPNSETFTELDAGTYEVTEEATAGWTLTDISCDDESTGDTGTRTATIVLAEGEDVTCTFTNTQDLSEPELGSITIVKNAVPDHAQDFSFTGDLGTFALDDDDDGTLSNSATFVVAAGTYEVTEGATEGWILTSVSCDDTDSSGSTETATATIVVAEGENVTCTFTNSQIAVAGDDDIVVPRQETVVAGEEFVRGSGVLPQTGPTHPLLPTFLVAVMFLTLGVAADRIGANGGIVAILRSRRRRRTNWNWS